MTKRPPEQRDLPPLLAAIRTRIPEVEGIWVFGSLARGRARPDSDIDLGVLARNPIDSVLLFDVGLELGVLAGRDVDLVDLRRVSTLLRHIVVTEGSLLAPIEPTACEAFTIDTAALYGALREERGIAHRLASGSRP